MVKIGAIWHPKRYAKEEGFLSKTHDLVDSGMKKWSRIKFGSFEYEGEVLDGKACGFGRMHSDSPRESYHGMFEDQRFHGAGCFFFENGDRFEGFFVNHKPVGEGIFTSGRQRLRVHYDGLKELADGADPQILGYAGVEDISEDSHILILAMCRASGDAPSRQHDYAHCRPVDARLALAAPVRADAPLLNPEAIAGSIAVVLCGGGCLATKVRHCQQAGAAAILVLGCDNDPRPAPPLQVPPPPSPSRDRHAACTLPARNPGP